MYTFKVITNLDQLEDVLEMVYKSRDEQIDLLMSVRWTYKSDVEPRSDVQGSRYDHVEGFRSE